MTRCWSVKADCFPVRPSACSPPRSTSISANSCKVNRPATGIWSPLKHPRLLRTTKAAWTTTRHPMMRSARHPLIRATAMAPRLPPRTAWEPARRHSTAVPTSPVPRSHFRGRRHSLPPPLPGPRTRQARCRSPLRTTRRPSHLAALAEPIAHHGVLTALPKHHREHSSCRCRARATQVPHRQTCVQTHFVSASAVFGRPATNVSTVCATL
mmetsp:Transcript_4356/g.10767  ORF Transcript_4356/g.10767 Transcript_4356/m.10767 type:complete len:211 (+) Transcript_4356:381-1013(+)